VSENFLAIDGRCDLPTPVAVFQTIYSRQFWWPVKTAVVKSRVRDRLISIFGPNHVHVHSPSRHSLSLFHHHHVPH